MTHYLLLFAGIIITCVFLNKFSSKVGIPVLLFFLLLGLYWGHADNEFASKQGWLVGDVSTIALIFIMFYGGFGTRWKSARPIIVEAGLLSTVGVILTAAFVGLFCHFALAWNWLESFLMGAVISSTDAATVFSILRTRKLGLKNNTAPLLEVESGSNDPISYMLTAIIMSLFSGSISAGNVAWQVFAQIVFGAGGGILIAFASSYMMKRIHFKNNGFDLLLVIAIALAAYALPQLVGGNGYLSAYIVGIYLGNSEFPGRKQLVAVFDSVTSLMQIIIFFLLGMLTIPLHLYNCLVPSLIIFVFLTFVARPLSIFGVLTPFRKYPAKQMGLIAFSGLRGAASIVFAILILTSETPMDNDIFSIVFCIVLMSIAFQGSLLPAVAKATGMIDTDNDVMTTFNDFKGSSELAFSCIDISGSNRWNGKSVKELDVPQGCLLVLVLRGDLQIIPDGNTTLHENDRIVICAPSFDEDTSENLIQHTISKRSKWVGKTVKEYPRSEDMLLILIQRDEQQIIPDGNTTLQEGDVLVLLKRKK